MNEDIIKNMTCLKCGGDLYIKDSLLISCKNCYMNYKYDNDKSIIYFNNQSSNINITTWDNIYKNGILQNTAFASPDFKKLISKIESSLSNIEMIQTQFPIIGLLNKHNIRQKKIIEIGCGTGTFSLLMKKLGIAEKVYIVDISEEALKSAYELFRYFNEEVVLILTNAEDLPFKKDSFDFSFSAGLIEHFKINIQKKLLSEHLRIAYYSIIQFPVSTIFYWFQRLFIVLINNFDWPFGYEAPLTYKRIKSIFKEMNIYIIDNSFHDSLTALLYKFGSTSLLKPLKKKNLLNKLFKTDLVLYCSRNPPG